MGCVIGGTPATSTRPNLDISASLTYTCLRRDTQLHCWGRLPGSAGSGEVAPLPRHLASDAQAIATANGQICILRVSGRVDCIDGMFDWTAPRTLAGTHLVQVAANEAMWCARDQQTWECHALDSTDSLGARELISTLPVDRKLHVFAGYRFCARGVADGAPEFWDLTPRTDWPGPTIPSTPVPLSPVCAPGAIAGGRRLCRIIDGTVECTSRVWHPLERFEAIAGLPPISRIEGWDEVLCGTTSDGSVWCWGENGCGLSDGEWDHAPRARDAFCRPRLRDPPERIALPLPAVDLAVGLHHACAALNDGSVYCWGSNEYGALGNNSAADSEVPVRVTIAR